MSVIICKIQSSADVPAQHEITHLSNHQEIIMSEIEVRIVKLEPMRMLSAYGFGKEPEGIAWEKIMAFGLEKGLPTERDYPTTYGFNNPNPSAGSPNYGYEIWLPVDESVQPEGDLRIVDFSGGLYAVTRFKGLENIGKVWGELVKWRESSKYKCADHQWMEHLLEGAGGPDSGLVFDLYLPIAE
jgi:DNA gyrase inhibitor GyrI